MLLLITLLYLFINAQAALAEQWLTTWGSMPQLTEPQNLPPSPFTAPNVVFRNTTLRQTIRATLGGDSFRLRISNVFGGSDLPVTAISVALPTNGSAGVSSIQPSSAKAVTFSGASSFIIPNGAQVLSDPIRLSVRAQSMVTVSIYTATGQTTNSISGHPGSRTTSWMAFGNQVNALDLAGPEKASTNHWYWASALEVWTGDDAGAIAIVGDSITDGRESTDNGNDRWPDLLLARLQDSVSTRNIAVINQAAGGNRILADGLGPNALGRIDRDVIALPGVNYAMIFEGTNDIGTGPITLEGQKIIEDRLIWAFKQMVERLHTAGIPVIGATITPFTGHEYGHPTREVTRQKVNEWIRTSRVFDVVVDFDKLLRDPEQPARFKVEYDGGDHLHPNVRGFQVMADAIPLGFFAKFKYAKVGGTRPRL